MSAQGDYSTKERDRLARIEQLALFDTQPEEEFDALTKLAARICDVPIALMTIVGADRQWFKSNVGFPEISGTPCDIAFCRHTIVGTGVLEIEDASVDPRFADNPLVTDAPGIKFYAGAAIILADGTRLGTICVIDRKPRRLSEDQLRMLRQLASIAAQTLDIREHYSAALAAAAKDRERIEKLYTATPAMLHSIDGDGRILSVSDAWLAEFGYSREEVLGRSIFDFHTPPSREHLYTIGRLSLLENGKYTHAGYEMRRKDGSVLDVVVSVITEHGAEGEPARYLGVVTDVTAQRRAESVLIQSEARYRALVEDQTDLVVLSSPDGRMTFANASFASYVGAKVESLLGTKLGDHYIEADRGDAWDNLAEIQRNLGVVKGDRRMPMADGTVRWVAWTSRAIVNPAGQLSAIHSVGRDITDLRLALEAIRSSQLLLERTGELAGIGGWEFDIATGTLRFSDEMCRLHGLPPGYLPTHEEAISYFAPKARPVIERAIQEGIESARPWDMELPFRTAKGEPRWVRTVGRARFEGDKLVGLVGAFQDVTERKRMKDELAESKELLQVTLDSIGDAVITTDVEGIVRWLNPVAERMTGWSKEEALGKPLAEIFRIVNGETREAAPDPIALAFGERQRLTLGQHTVLISRDGGEYGIEESASPIRDDSGAVHGAVLIFRDVSEQRRLSREMSHRASHDGLTGLVNRAEFENRLASLLMVAREDATSNALMFIDLDQFKLINDACGHAVGDQFLRQVGKLIQGCVRGRDTVARLGGDEFGVILEHCDTAQAQRVAQTICDQMEAYRFQYDGKRFRVGASIGMVPVDMRSGSTGAIMQAADRCCYAAKEAGRNRVYAWSDTDQIVKARHGQMQWVGRLEQALDDDHFELHGQKIQSMGCLDEGLHCEILLRLKEGTGTITPPGAFLPAAERFHMATRIDRWVVRHVFDWLETAARSETPIDLIAINLSGQSIGDRAFHRDVIDLIDGVGFDVRKLCFEITETAAITNLADARLFIHEVRALGVKIALDDFGAGASSFGYLKSLPVDFLKIDGQFITRILEDKLDYAAVRCFSDVAKAIGVKTIAEFVEREDVKEELELIGIDMAQGYLLHRPEPIDGLLRADPVRRTAPVGASLTLGLG